MSAQRKLGIKVPKITPYNQATGFTTQPQQFTESYWLPCHKHNVQQFHANNDRNRQVPRRVGDSGLGMRVARKQSGSEVM